LSCSFFAFDGGAVLTLIFIAILAQQLAASTPAGKTVARSMMIANLAGGFAAVLAYILMAFVIVGRVLPEREERPVRRLSRLAPENKRRACSRS